MRNIKYKIIEWKYETCCYKIVPDILCKNQIPDRQKLPPQD